jgi:hypothetical protein
MLDKSLGLDLTKLIDRFLHQALVSFSFHYKKTKTTMPTYVKIILITMGILVVGGIIYSTINNSKIYNSIAANPKKGTAEIIERSIPKVTSTTLTDARYTSRFKYKYEISDVKYEGLQNYSFDIKHQDDLIGKTFPMIYDAKNPQNSRLLILEQEYQDFGLQQPDSLKKYNVIFK